MELDEFELLFVALRSAVRVTHGNFVAPFIPARFGQRPEEYAPSVKAYCVLSFAAFEYYFECVALILAERMLQYWKRDRRFSDLALRLALLYPDRKFAEAFPEALGFSVTSEERVALAFDEFDTFVSKFNHSINAKVFQKLFWPSGVADAAHMRFMGSLEQLRSERGSYAHRITTRSLSPEAATALVQDCLDLAALVQEHASIKLSGNSALHSMRSLLDLLRSRV